MICRPWNINDGSRSHNGFTAINQSRIIISANYWCSPWDFIQTCFIRCCWIDISWEGLHSSYGSNRDLRNHNHGGGVCSTNASNIRQRKGSPAQMRLGQRSLARVFLLLVRNRPIQQHAPHQAHTCSLNSSSPTVKMLFSWTWIPVSKRQNKVTPN